MRQEIERHRRWLRIVLIPVCLVISLWFLLWTSVIVRGAVTSPYGYRGITWGVMEASAQPLIIETLANGVRVRSCTDVEAGVYAITWLIRYILLTYLEWTLCFLAWRYCGPAHVPRE